jgi:nucleotide-binding universal stress UspA family protein
MYEKILVPLDGSKLAETALPHAESLARRYNATLILLSVINPPIITDRETVTTELYQQQLDVLIKDTELYLKGRRGEFKEKRIKAESLVIQGPVVEGIVTAADNHSVDLVIIASHGRTGLKRVFFGSIAAGVLNRIEQPLMVIRCTDSKSD